MFANRELLAVALTHSSVQKKKYNNERLEFLGDRVLGLVVADMIYRVFPDENEGALAKRHTALVQQAALGAVARELKLASYVRLSAAEIKAGGLKKETILSDAVEALIGAVYLDGGFASAQAFVIKLWDEMLHRQSSPPQDPKTRLQEWAQSRALPLPSYKVLARSGSDHAPRFEVEVTVKDHGSAVASAASKRAAEKEAAIALLTVIGEKT